MNTGEAVFLVLVTAFLTVFITGVIVDGVHETKHTYWVSESKYEAIDEAIEKLVTAGIDSLIVTHPNRPNVVGYIYFKEDK